MKSWKKTDMFQAIFGKVDEFGWWDMEIIQTEAYTQFTSKVEDVADMMSTNNRLKGVLAFRGVFDLAFLFIVEI